MTENSIGTQSENVATQDAPQPPDKAVVISDTPEEVVKEPEATDETKDQKEKPASENVADVSNDQKSETDKTKSKRRDTKAERRIRRLTAQINDEKRRGHHAEKENRRLAAEIARLQEETPKPAKPVFEDFDTPEEFGKAFSKWEKGKNQPPAKSSKPPSQREPTSDSRSPENETLQTDVNPNDEKFSSFMAKGQELLGDEFLEALDDRGTPISPIMGDFMIEDDLGPMVYVHLVNNPEEAKTIDAAPQHKQTDLMKALIAKAKKGQLDAGEDDFNFEESESSSKPKTVSKAKTPPSSTKEEGANAGSVNPENESMEEYSARRRKESAHNRGGYISS